MLGHDLERRRRAQRSKDRLTMERFVPILVALMACYASHQVDDDGPAPDATVPRVDGGVDAGADASLDGGPIGPAVADCLEAARTGRDGQRCTFEGFCRTSDLCVAMEVRCFGDRLSVNRWDLTDDFDLSSCGTSEGMAEIVGTTPFGPIELTRAWASHSHAFAVDAVLVAHDEGPALACGTDRLGVWLSPIGGPSYLGVHEALVLVSIGGREPSVVPGTFEVFETDDSAFIGGQLTIDEGEWQLSGFIAAAPCPTLDRSGP